MCICVCHLHVLRPRQTGSARACDKPEWIPPRAIKYRHGKLSYRCVVCRRISILGGKVEAKIKRSTNCLNRILCGIC